MTQLLDITRTPQNELVALYEAEVLLYKAMCAIPSGDGPTLPPEFMTIAHARQYLGTQIHNALIVPEHWADELPNFGQPDDFPMGNDNPAAAIEEE